MPRSTPTDPNTWAAALAGSVGLHAALWWAVGGDPIEPRGLARSSVPLSVYLLPAPNPVPGPDATTDVPIAGSSEPQVESPAVTESEPALPAQNRPDAPGTTSPLRAAVPVAPQPTIDWAAELHEAVLRLRDPPDGFRSFAFPQPRGDASNRNRASAEADRAATDLSVLAEATAWGERRLWLNDSCYESTYAPGSVLAEAHRFSNSFVVCIASGPAKPRGDLFSEIRPAYLR